MFSLACKLLKIDAYSNGFQKIFLGENLYDCNQIISNQIAATIPHINSEANPPPPIINVVCKYLRQFLGISFGIATLPICCNIK